MVSDQVAEDPVVFPLEQYLALLDRVEGPETILQSCIIPSSSKLLFESAKHEMSHKKTAELIVDVQLGWRMMRALERGAGLTDGGDVGRSWPVQTFSLAPVFLALSPFLDSRYHLHPHLCFRLRCLH
jgi:hypothetical protein